MPTARSRSGDRSPSDRRKIGLTVPASLKRRMLEAAEVYDWSVGDWILAMSAEHGHELAQRLDEAPGRRRVGDTTFLSIYVTAEERTELDELARRAGLNRSAYVTAVAQVALGADPGEVTDGLRAGEVIRTPAD